MKKENYNRLISLHTKHEFPLPCHITPCDFFLLAFKEMDIKNDVV